VKLIFENFLPFLDLKVSLSHPVTRPDDLDAFLLTRLRRRGLRIPTDIRARFQPFVTSLGWHGTMVEVDSILAARYDFLHFVAGVVIVADHRQRLAETRPTVRAYLKSARPDFRDELACVANLWS